MKKSVATALLFSALPIPAFAAPPVAFTWTGFYIGVNEGYSFGISSKTEFFDGGPFASNQQGAQGFSGGGQFGYIYQFPNMVVAGLEADFQGSTLTGQYPNVARSYSYSFDDGEGFGAGSSLRTSQTEVNWWGSLRGRLGYAFGNLLPYITGGFAYGRIENSGTYSASGFGFFDGDPLYTYNVSRASSYGGVVPGWALGAGFEYALTQNLTFKAEYIYVDLGNLNHVSAFDPAYSSSTWVAFNTFRVGFNWNFFE